MNIRKKPPRPNYSIFLCRLGSKLWHVVGSSMGGSRERNLRLLDFVSYIAPHSFIALITVYL